ncbi:MAG: hypothetical protein H7Y37_03590 [Anaerolineae bacterium]|nr:hypothetical protein [Gloeobacterales cyanobacterium ES-bin-313]
MKPENIDLQMEYPCPRCKRGQLQAIILTDAFGCDRCSQIFGLTEDNQTLEQLSTSYPYKKAWQWTGASWRDQSRGLNHGYYPLVLAISALIPLVWLPFVLQSKSGLVTFTFTVVLIVVALTIGLARRSRP